jgi:hypothetical protein
MKNLFQPEAVDEVITRLDALQPATQRQWGKMDAAQMMAHCSASFDLASGRLVRPRVLLGWVIGPLLRAIYSNEKPFWKNSPTDEKLIVSDPRDFSREREQLKARIRQFHLGGETQVTKHPHPFFGSLSAHEWSTGMYKHLDHHLRQFGV